MHAYGHTHVNEDAVLPYSTTLSAHASNCMGVSGVSCRYTQHALEACVGKPSALCIWQACVGQVACQLSLDSGDILP